MNKSKKEIQAFDEILAGKKELIQSHLRSPIIWSVLNHGTVATREALEWWLEAVMLHEDLQHTYKET